MNYTWFVCQNNKVIGTVIAEDELSAICYAQDKFNFGFEDGHVSVKRKQKKRKKK